MLGRYRKIVRIMPPGTLEGGDVLRIDRKLYVGRSARTNDAGNMTSVARTLSDRDIEDLGHYTASLF